MVASVNLSGMTKIVIIGAGSQFGGKLSRDILSLPALRDARICLCDIDAERLAGTEQYVRRMIDGHGLKATLSTSTDRRALLKDADFVVVSVSVGGAAYSGHPVTAEVNIPRKYGITQSVADTIGVGGIFRFLRTGPEQLAICRDMETLCPNALMLNYTNPMCMLTMLHSMASGIRNVGLCHSVQHTAHEIEGYLGLERDSMRYLCAGINHQAWYLTLTQNNKDIYPALKAALCHPETVAKDNIRFAMLEHFGWFVTESSRHCSEYHPYFRRTPNLMEQYQLTDWTPSETPAPPRQWLKDENDLPPLTQSEEYASKIIEAVVTNTPYRFNGNVLNTDQLIHNLPENCCVELPCLVDGQGVQPTRIGTLPTVLAHLNLSNIAPQELAVRAILDRDRDAAFYACLLDPLTKSVCSLDQTRKMFDELWEAEGELLAHFH
jgi:alpha-galactosidase